MLKLKKKMNFICITVLNVERIQDFIVSIPVHYTLLNYFNNVKLEYKIIAISNYFKCSSLVQIIWFTL